MLLEALHLSPLYKWVYETALEGLVRLDRQGRAALGFAPKYSNKDALVRNYEWYLAHLDEFKDAAASRTACRGSRASSALRSGSSRACDPP